MAAARRALTSLALGADVAKCLFLAFGAFTAWRVGLDAVVLAGCVFGALIVIILLPPAIGVARLPRFADRWTDIAAYGIFGMLATPLALTLLQGAIQALGLA